MVANAALFIGLAEGLRPQVDTLPPALPFSLAEYNFYRAAQHGLEARLVWPIPARPVAARPVSGLEDPLLAREGLRARSGSRSRGGSHLDVIERRLAARQTGARAGSAAHQSGWRLHGREQAAREMLAQLRAEHVEPPVSEWK